MRVKKWVFFFANSTSMQLGADDISTFSRIYEKFSFDESNVDSPIYPEEEYLFCGKHNRLNSNSCLVFQN